MEDALSLDIFVFYLFNYSCSLVQEVEQTCSNIFPPFGFCHLTLIPCVRVSGLWLQPPDAEMITHSIAN